MAESERYLPVLVDKLEKVCEDAGLRNDSIVMRMTGCPNVSRPRVLPAPGSRLILALLTSSSCLFPLSSRVALDLGPPKSPLSERPPGLT